MRLRRKRETRRRAVVAELQALRDECESDIDRSYINDAILYANIGRDRYRLDSSYVEAARKQLTKWADQHPMNGWPSGWKW